ncbi:hypothetical protein EAI88_12120 [Eubacterium ramulus]|uniref:Stage V sporulation protein K n=1 Tax=Eubacterium ramulus TaxID=39490 RepID=A0A844E006_EUBRA|nr:hypothetical protein [Eubacterium ramulus]MSC78820.1 hypothetical protein [Eubacterium ramulus]MSC93124.1 hypothetical protein [Eubacterium ramulus]MSD16045.1 hypothetical protein [Eubacterium ramulus]RYS96572.1 hypothetical protein EAI88_12120 [Eubacterium ramulus]
MDKYEYKLKLEQIQNLFAAGDYLTAAEMADTINWKKVRSSTTLCMVGEIYEKTGKYDACREVLLQAYDHSPIGRNIVCQLAEVAIKAKHVDEAEEYYNEFLEIAPKDNMRYVLAYEISCLKDQPLTDRIAILEELKEHEYTEKWAYELAVLYGQAELRDKCVETCDELILWFGDGEYVEKALDLKRLYQPLTPAQEDKYKQFREKKGMVEISLPQSTERKNVIKEMVKTAECTSEEASETTVTASKFNTSKLQEELAKSMRQIMNATEKETVADTMENIKKIVSDIPYLNGEHEEEAEHAFDQEKINAQVDRSLKKDFHALMKEQEESEKEEQETQKQDIAKEEVRENADDAQSEIKEIKHAGEKADAEEVASAQASIEEVLEEWKKTKRAAEAAMAAADQKKLEMSKENALLEAGQIMDRLKTLIPILSATPGEDLPVPEDTVAAKLASDDTMKAANEEAAENESAAAPEEAENVEASDDIASEDENTAAKAEATDSDVDVVMKSASAENSADQAETSAVEEADSDLAKEMAQENSEADDTADDTVSTDTSDSVVEEDIAAADISGVTREMPDLSAYQSRVSAETPDESADTEAGDAETTDIEAASETVPVSTEDRADEDELHVVESAPDEELEKMLVQATQMFVENANVEVPVGKAAAVSQDTGVLPEIKLPDDLKEEQKAYDLTEEQKELFSYFLPVPGMEDQIRQILLGAKSRLGNSVTSLTGNILIQGEEGSGKTVFATSLIKAIEKEVGNEDAKIGKISASSLNGKDFAALIPQIDGGYLIIDKAGELNRETALRMSQLMEQNTRGMVILLEDTRAGIRKAMQLDFGFAKKFTEKVDIPIFTIDELVEFGKSYAKEMECTIDQMGVLALYNRINNIQKLERATTLAEVKDIVDEAIENAEGGGIKKAFGSIFSKKYNENDYLILHEKDFE